MTQASTALPTVLTIGVGVLVANLYYAQPLIASIGAEQHVSPDVAGSVVSVGQRRIWHGADGGGAGRSGDVRQCPDLLRRVSLPCPIRPIVRAVWGKGAGRKGIVGLPRDAAA